MGYCGLVLQSRCPCDAAFRPRRLHAVRAVGKRESLPLFPVLISYHAPGVLALVQMHVQPATARYIIGDSAAVTMARITLTNRRRKRESGSAPTAFGLGLPHGSLPAQGSFCHRVSGSCAHIGFYTKLESCQIQVLLITVAQSRGLKQAAFATTIVGTCSTRWSGVEHSLH